MLEFYFAFWYDKVRSLEELHLISQYFIFSSLHILHKGLNRIVKGTITLDT